MSKTSKFLWLFMALLYVGLGLYFVIDSRKPKMTMVTISDGLCDNVYEYPVGSTITLTTPTNGYAEFQYWKVVEGDSTVNGEVLTVGKIASSIEPVFDEIPFNINISADFKKTVNISVEGFPDVISLTPTVADAQYHGVISSSAFITIIVIDSDNQMPFRYECFDGVQSCWGNSNGLISISVGMYSDDLTTFDLSIEPVYLDCSVYANGQYVSALSVPSGIPFDLSVVDTSAYDLCTPSGWVTRDNYNITTEVSGDLLIASRSCSIYRVYENSSRFSYNYDSTSLDSLSLTIQEKNFCMDRYSTIFIPKSGTFSFFLSDFIENRKIILSSDCDLFAYSVNFETNESGVVYLVSYSDAGDSLSLSFDYDYGVISSGSTIINRSILAQLDSSQLAYMDEQFYVDESALCSALDNHKNFGTAGVFDADYNVYNVRINLGNFVRESTANSIVFNFEIDGVEYSFVRSPFDFVGDIVSGISVSAFFDKSSNCPSILYLSINLNAFTNYIKLTSIYTDGILVYTAP